ncbi:GNAT family N-acetyltransferase [uncultured Amnibacterium sp.]|uniref:GNAT family N-acetyltransferase n=1 Tax=uncultured Amnibacterium sp. TaxID=1631851 RepID=UPI0035CB24B9
MADVVIRLAEPREYPDLGALTHAAYAADYPLHPGYAHTLRHPEQRAADYEPWVAEDTGTGVLVGTTSVLRPGREEGRGRVRDGELYFRLLAVSPTARRRGIGALLTRFTYGLALDRGQHTVALNSGQHMTGAHALYRGLGFTRIEDRDVRLSEDGRDFTVYTFTRPVVPADRVA